MTLTRVAAVTGLTLMATGLAHPALSQDNNSIIVSQVGSENTLRVDQSAANNSLVAGVPPVAGVSLDESFGLNLGSNDSDDEASFIIFGDLTAGEDNSALFTSVDRKASATQNGSGNSADITLAGDGSFAGLEQVGNDNVATIGVDGNNAGGIIVQSGNTNDGTVNVGGNSAFGELIQIGDDNETAFTVSGNPSADVSFTVQGNGITTNIPASVVTSSGGQVTIVQRQLGNFVQ